VPVQTKLSFIEDLPVPRLSVWDQLEEDHKSVVLEMLARVIAKMIAAEQHSGANNDRSQNQSGS
jgi:hypothetical protein